MKKLLVMGMIAMSTLSTTATPKVFASEITESNAVVKNDANTTDEAVSDNGDVDTYRTLLLDADVYDDKNGTWTSSQFSIPSNAENGINLYYQNNSKHETVIEFYKVNRWGRDKIIDSFTVSPGDRVVENPDVKRGANYYVAISSKDGGIIKGNLRVATI